MARRAARRSARPPACRRSRARAGATSSTLVMVMRSPGRLVPVRAQRRPRGVGAEERHQRRVGRPPRRRRGARPTAWPDRARRRWRRRRRAPAPWLRSSMPEQQLFLLVAEAVVDHEADVLARAQVGRSRRRAPRTRASSPATRAETASVDRPLPRPMPTSKSPANAPMTTLPMCMPVAIDLAGGGGSDEPRVLR